MLRYIALICRSGTEKDKLEAKIATQQLCKALPGWSRILEHDGLFVLQSGESAKRSQAYFLDRGGGVVLGRLFTRQSNQDRGHSAVSLHGHWSREIVKSGSRCLVQDFWGSYAAFVRDEGRDSTFVLRDPSGGVFCFWAKMGNVYVYFSHIIDVVPALNLALSVDWDSILDGILHPEFYAGETGFREIKEVVPGECHEIGKDGFAKHLYWNPCKIWNAGPFVDTQAAANTVRKTTEYCVEAWASAYGSVIHNLSGGLDSAIVLACLAKSRRTTDILCVNYYGVTQISDERFFARKAATLHNCEFMAYELPYIGRSLYKLIEETPIWVRPTVHLFGIPSQSIKARLAQERGAGAFTSGEGGDHIFFKTSSSLIAADYAFMHGINRSLLEICYDAARTLRVSYWSVLGTAVRHGLLHQTADLRRRKNTMPNSAVLESAAKERIDNKVEHPWMKDAHALPNAKRLQIKELCKVITRYPHFGAAEVADIVHPLLSQPIIAACIRTPAYMTCLDGRDRGLARRAFAKGLPREIL